MERRTFLAGTMGSSIVSAATSVSAHVRKPAAPDTPYYYLIRRYTMANGNPALTDGFFRDALLPAAGRLGIAPIGVFTSWFGDESLSGKIVLLPGRSLEVLADLERHLSADADYMRIGAPFLGAHIKEAPFQRLHSTLLRAIPGLKQMELPATLLAQKNRLFELRHYEQPTYASHDLKVQMFAEGEAHLLDSSGLTGVMYAVDIIGDRLPRLTYMWVYSDLGEREKAEARFFAMPERKSFFDLPRYAGVPSAIYNNILRPTDYSQI
jgi:hypothetical protein